MTKWQSGGEKPESAGKGCRVEREGSLVRLTEEIRKDPTVQHDLGVVFHTGKSNKCLLQMRNRFVSPGDKSYRVRR